MECFVKPASPLPCVLQQSKTLRLELKYSFLYIDVFTSIPSWTTPSPRTYTLLRPAQKRGTVPRSVSFRWRLLATGASRSKQKHHRYPSLDQGCSYQIFPFPARSPGFFGGSHVHEFSVTWSVTACSKRGQYVYVPSMV